LLAAIFFDGGGGTNLWNNPDNWSLHRSPTAEDDVSIGDTFQVVLDGTPAAVRSLSLDDGAALTVRAALSLELSSYGQATTSLNLEAGGALGGTGELNVFGQLNWTGGTMGGSGRTLIGTGGHAVLSGTDAKLLSRTLRVEESLEMVETDLSLNDGVLELDARATMLMTDATIQNAGGTNRVENAGRINGSGWMVTFFVPLYHSGTAGVNCNFALWGGGSATGTFDITYQNRVLVHGPGYAFDAGAKFFGEYADVVFGDGTSTVVEPQDLTHLIVNRGDVTFGGNLKARRTTVRGPNSALKLAGALSDITFLEVSDRARMQLIGGGGNVIRARRADILDTARLDVGRGGMIVDYEPGSSTFDTVRAKITSGYANGAWTGPGICSEIAAATGRALGYGEASALFASFPATFMGQTVDDTSILVRYTRHGDANLDGTVDLDDFNRLAPNFGSWGALWSDGDFGYDGFVDLKDFNLLAGSFGQSVAPAAGETDELEALVA
jgi:hypothetical protein